MYQQAFSSLKYLHQLDQLYIQFFFDLTYEGKTSFYLI